MPGYWPRCIEPDVRDVIPATEIDATEEMVSA